MRRIFALSFALILALAAFPAAAAARPVRVAIVTSEGRIIIALDPRAPITTANFLHYVDTRRLEGTTFYRAARTGPGGRFGLIQGGVDTNIRLTYLPIKHEPTSLTGIHHLDGTVSMARNDPGSATANFFIVVGNGSHLDAAGEYPGYAAFAHVVAGMDVVKRILAGPTYPGGYSASMVGQTLRRKVTIVSLRRVP